MVLTPESVETAGVSTYNYWILAFASKTYGADEGVCRARNKRGNLTLCHPL